MIDIDLLEKAVQRGGGEFSSLDILKLVEEGKMQVMRFPFCSGQAILEFVKYPKKTRVRVVLFAGEFDVRVVDFVESYAKALGFDGMEMSGRLGWERKLQVFQPTHKHLTLVKDFEEKEK